MLKAILFDLDDTLLGNSMDRFLPAYFRALTRYLDHLVSPQRLISELMRATQVMDTNTSRELTNEEAFASAFYPAMPQERFTLESAFEQFYAEEFPKLRRLTRRRSEARPLVEWTLEQGFQVVVATNPMFPRSAVERRLAWAGVPVDQFDYSLVTTYENMHTTKSHPAYYREILERLGRRPGECLMVGDSWDKDIVPASSVGLHVYWITEEDELPASGTAVCGWGTLAELSATVTNGSGGLEKLIGCRPAGERGNQTRRT
ncbi:MAG: HAD family hydrolase [Anaerolineae bacterium]|jgi:HAD superfamily hydrolase (TIGR01549 family)